ncbi:muts domain V-domain-containing protein [Gautieria morchelliformis]|nr:muts domain V-domain-containing protein [Gautieria morchelliformis]
MLLKERMYYELRRLNFNLRASSYNPAVFLLKTDEQLMSILMRLPPCISISSIRLAQKNTLIKSAIARIRFKTGGTVSGVENEVNKVLVRKKYTDLPTNLKLSDGSSAPALGEWIGGLSSPTKLLGSRSHLKTELGENSPGDGTLRLPQNQLATEILENLARFPHCILLTRVGNFYESYFDQAAEVARLLSIKLTKRIWDRQEVLMCGFPIIHLDRHLKVLVQVHQRCVALCEEFKRQNSEEGFDRRVVRVLTPGTLIDESFLNPYENNYLLAIDDLRLGPTPCGLTCDSKTDDSNDANVPPLPLKEGPLGLAWIDVSTGEFFAQQSTIGDLKDDVARIAPREVVLNSRLKEMPSHPILLAVTGEGCFVSYISPSQLGSTPLSTVDLTSPLSHADDLIAEKPASQNTSAKHVFTQHETSAVELLTAFLQAHLLEHMPLLSSPARQGQQDRMHMDSQTIKALEIREGMREGGTTGSLLSVVKRTVTSSGTRLLARWLCSPSISVTEIRARQNLVSLFYAKHHLRDDLVQLLKRLEDASRIVQRFLLGKGDVTDLSTIKNAIDTWEEIKSKIELEHQVDLQGRSTGAGDEWLDLRRLLNRMADLRKLAWRIGMAVDTNALNHSDDEADPESLISSVHDAIRTNLTTSAWTGQLKTAIRPNFSPELASLHARLTDAEAARQRLEQELQLRYDAPSLSLRSSGKHGVHVHIGKSKRDLGKIEASSQFIPIASTTSSKSFFNQAWHRLGTDIIDTIMQIFVAEKHAFEMLRLEVNIEAGVLRRNARIMDELDVTLGFANLANELQFVRPVLDDSTSYTVTNGRHPSVELGLLSSGRVFMPNTVSLTPSSRLHIITGPNMAGKSTLLRQTALLAILAQCGSFVPADTANVGIIDKLFSRVGAKDDLFRDRSTFMVEMLETADILNHATDRSLVIMDEVGRGTTVKDGLAIAFATVYHLYNVNRCRALFATHFHEVADMLGYTDDSGAQGFFKNIGFFCTDVDETQDGHFAYSHRLRPGVNRDSHGLKVAKLGGMPAPALRIAQDALDWMKVREANWVADKAQLRVVGESLAREHTALPSKASKP